MKEGKPGALVVGHRKPLTHDDSKLSLPVEAVVATAVHAVVGAAGGGLMSILCPAFNPPPPSASLNLQAKSLFQQAQLCAQCFARGPLVDARNFAVLAGVNAGILCVLRRLRGKEDVQSSMVAGCASGVMFSLVSGMRLHTHAGVFFALGQGALFMVMEEFSKPRVEDMLFNETRDMLTSLGLEYYEKNFKSGLLTDTTLPLLTDSALQAVKIPIGPRLLILNHIEREKEVKKKGRRE